MLHRLKSKLLGGESRLDFRVCPGGWEEAQTIAQGARRPDPRPHAARVRESTLAVRRGEAPATRDSVILDRPEYPYPVFASLLKLAARGGRLAVVDFGGALGGMYLQFKRFAPAVPVRWSIVELPEMVAIGRASFESEELRFFGSLDDCLREERPDVGILSGVLHFIQRPYTLLADFAASTVGALVIDRLPLTEEAADIVAAQIVTGQRFASDRCFPCWLFASGPFERRVREDWILVDRFQSLDSNERAGGVTIRFEGMILERCCSGDAQDLGAAI